MDQNLLTDLTEKFYRGEMTDTEKADFSVLRQHDQEAARFISAHLHLLEELNQMSLLKKFKEKINLVEDELASEKFFEDSSKRFKTVIVSMWRQYKRTAAVAAAVALIISSVVTGFSFLNKDKKSVSLTPLVDNKLNQLQYQLRQMEYKLNDVTPRGPKFEANFRATGFLVDGKGYVVTNAHVVDKANNLIVENMKGQQFNAVPLYSNAATDLAILKITDTSFQKINTLPYNFKKENAELAEEIYTLGYPREEIVYSKGYISSKSGYFGDTSAYQINISVNPGNSGGPVINKAGNIIGIISSKETDADGVVFAIRAKNIFDAIEDVDHKDDEKIHLSGKNLLSNKSRVNQIKSLEDFVYKIKGN